MSPLTNPAETPESAETNEKPKKKRRSPATGCRAILTQRRASIPGFDRHTRKCDICRHKDVLEIEQAYLDWCSARDIVQTFELTYTDTVYRHARALGLDTVRRQNVRFALEKLIEQVDQVSATSSTVLRAIRALSCIDSKGRWTDPPSAHIIFASNDPPAQTPNPSAEPDLPQAESYLFYEESAAAKGEPSTAASSDRVGYEELEIAVTDTNKREDVISNR
jgi:hypothetical protein